jgi:hypothetical protein
VTPTPSDGSPCRLLIGGDLCAIGRNREAFVSADRRTLLGPLDGLFAAADLRLLNLECPLIDQPDPLPKTGPVLGGPRQAIAGISALDIDLAVLANNHIMDHSASGLASTLEALDGAGIAHCGAGPDLARAAAHRILECRGLKVGVLAMTANEFSIAGDSLPGANPIDLLALPQAMSALRAACDIPLVFVHAGPNRFPWPTPRLQRLCRSLASLGARAVICQHSHVAGCMETVRNGEGRDCLIVYGQGNLFFDLGSRGESEWNRGLLVELRISGDGVGQQVALHAYRQSVDGPGLALMPEEPGAAWLAAFHERSRACTDPGRVSREFETWCRARADETLLLLLGENRWLKRLNRHFPFAARLFGAKRRRLYLNLLRCEDHREMLETILDLER